MKVYLAGPDVFLADAHAIGAAKAARCAAFGLQGLFPLENEVEADHPAPSRAIFEGNLAMVRRADAILANLTPFRGVSADPGTAFELGVAFALGKPVAAYSNVPGDLRTRVHGTVGLAQLGAAVMAGDGMHVEDFGLADNLMLSEAVSAAGLHVVRPEHPLDDPWHDLGPFETALAGLAAVLASRPAPVRDAR